VKKPIVALAFVAAILLTGIFACQKYSSNSNGGSSQKIFPPDVMVSANLQGRVIDQDGIPVAGAIVTSGTASTSTDINGVFTFSDISLSSRFGYVQAAKTGYFTGSRSIATNAGSSNFVSIRLITRTETGSFSATTGGKISPFAGDTVSFAPSGIVTAATNAAYTGTVHVFASYLNPTNNNVFQYMPGDLRGIGSDGNEAALQSFGMMNVELRDDNGNKLQLASGQQATITVAIPDSLQALAPATIPLWYFNDSTGRWMQQGSGTRQGNNYVGNVGHFTWWNFDLVYTPMSFKVRFKDQFGNGVPYTQVDILYSSGGKNIIMFGGYTDSTGFVSGTMPAGKALTLVLGTECGNIIAGVNVPPTLAPIDLGTVTITDPETDLTLSGKVVDCFNNPVASGYVNVAVDGLNHRAGVVNGSFTLSIHRCYNSNVPVNIAAADLGTSQQGSTTTMNNVIQGKLDVGTISACGISVSQFMTVTVNGNTYSQTNPQYLSYSNFSFNSGNPYVNFSIPGLSGTGTFSPSSFYMNAGNHNFALAGGSSVQCTITAFGAINQFITGTFTGNIYDSTANGLTPLNGSFKIMRSN
jgi:hypothetical protein